jgi:hypothetical protein
MAALTVPRVQKCCRDSWELPDPIVCPTPFAPCVMTYFLLSVMIESGNNAPGEQAFLEGRRRERMGMAALVFHRSPGSTPYRSTG